MAFRTKLDFSSNRQVKQHEKTITSLSGGTSFGLPYSAMTYGPDLNTSAVTQTISILTGNTSTFSGNNTTTIFTWFDSRMDLGSSSLSAITPSNSATTQNTGIIFTPDTTTTIDGNLVNLTYSGVSFDMSPLTMVSLGGGDYSGTVVTYTLEALSASTLDFTGRTIWADVSGITRTERLIITNNPQIGYVWTCVDSEGMGEWQYNGTGSTSTIWTAGTGVNSAVLGGSNIIGNLDNTVYAPNLILNTGGTSSMLGINTSTPNYTIDAIGTNNRFYYNSGSLGNITISATTGLPSVGVVAGTSNSANNSASVTFGVRAWDDLSYPIYGYQGDAFIYAGIYTNGLNIISNDGSTLGTGADYIRFYAGQATGAGGGNNPDLHIQGSGSSRGYVAINIPSNQDPTQQLDVNGNGRFRSISSSASSGALHYTSDGTLTTNTSDERLKTNVRTLNGALNKVNQLRGVSYNWTENPTGDTRIGFVAQEVNNVAPELTFVNPNSPDKYMGVHYDNVTALLVEAVKELSSNITTSNNTHLETQTILAEDNNIELNYSGTQESAIGGGIRVLHALGVDSAAELITNSEGDFITNNDFKPNSLTIPFYKPNSSEDINGNIGNITRDDEYLYIKCQDGWRRSNLERF
jgi:hypothetical protein